MLAIIINPSRRQATLFDPPPVAARLVVSIRKPNHHLLSWSSVLDYISATTTYTSVVVFPLPPRHVYATSRPRPICTSDSTRPEVLLLR